MIAPPSGAQGEFQGGKCVRGTFRHASGSVYEGEFLDGMKHGRGTHRFARQESVAAGGDMYDGDMYDGEMYDGEWRDDQMDGRGTYTYADNGGEYEGDFKNGSWEGHGTYKHASGSVYVGEWKGSKKDGRRATHSALRTHAVSVHLPSVLC